MVVPLSIARGNTPVAARFSAPVLANLMVDTLDTVVWEGAPALPRFDACDAGSARNVHVNIEVLPVPIEQRPVLARLLELYLHDYSEFDGRDIGEQGSYEYRYLDHYWTEVGRYPFVARVQGRLAGFALVRVLPSERGPVTHMAEFFVLRKYRRLGVGEAVARQLFDRFPGAWAVSQAARNEPAKQFWRSVIGRYTDDMFTEELEDDRVVQRFHSDDGRRASDSIAVPIEARNPARRGRR